MPRPFSAFVEIEQRYVGEVLTRIRGLRGVVAVGFDDGKKKKSLTNGHDEGDEPEHRAARGPYKKYDETGDQAMVKLLTRTPMMSYSDLRLAFESMGRSPASINSVSHVMMKKGELVRGEDGNYRLSKKMKDRLRHRVASKKTRR